MVTERGGLAFRRADRLSRAARLCFRKRATAATPFGCLGKHQSLFSLRRAFQRGHQGRHSLVLERSGLADVVQFGDDIVGISAVIGLGEFSGTAIDQKTATFDKQAGIAGAHAETLGLFGGK